MFNTGLTVKPSLSLLDFSFNRKPLNPMTTLTLKFNVYFHILTQLLYCVNVQRFFECLLLIHEYHSLH